MTKKQNQKAATIIPPNANKESIVITTDKAIYQENGKPLCVGEYILMKATSCTGEAVSLALTPKQANEVARYLKETAEQVERKAGTLILPF